MTNIQYKVDDMTAAPMDVKQWVDTEVGPKQGASLFGVADEITRKLSFINPP